MAVQFTVMSIDDEQLTPPRKAVFDKREISIGRSRLNDLVLDHAGVSNTHARIRVENLNGSSKFYVSDLDSTNGTMIGNKRLDPRTEIAVPERDRIMIAGYILKVEYVPDSASPKVEPAKPVNGHAEATPPLVEGKATDAFIIPEAPVTEEVRTLPRSATPGIKPARAVVKEEPIEEPVQAPVVEQEPEDEAKRGIPSFAAHATLLIQDEDIQLDFVATQLLRLSGTVMHRGEPLTGAVVRDAALGEVTTGKDGTFVFKDVLEGTNYALTFEKTGFVFSGSPMSGSLNDGDVSLDVTAKKLFAISGKITHKGKSLPGVTIDGGKLGVVVTDAAGVYRFAEVLEGEEYTLKASKDGYTFGTIRKKA